MHNVSNAIDEIVNAYQSGGLIENKNCYTVKWMKELGLNI